MHDVLHIPELLELIFTFVSYPKLWDLVSCALTSREWEDVAIMVLYRMPMSEYDRRKSRGGRSCEQLRSTGILSAISRIVQSETQRTRYGPLDLARALKYCSWVRHFSIPCGLDEYDHLPYLGLLTEDTQTKGYNPRSPFIPFPNLQHLKLHIGASDALFRTVYEISLLFPHLIAPSLHCVGSSSHSPLPELYQWKSHTETLQSQLFLQFSMMSTMTFIPDFGPDESIILSFMPLYCNFLHCVRELCLVGITLGISEIRTLASLESLQTLDIGNCRIGKAVIGIEGLEIPECGGFKELDNVMINQECASKIYTLLKHFDLRVAIKHLTVHCGGYDGSALFPKGTLLEGLESLELSMSTHTSDPCVFFDNCLGSLRGLQHLKVKSQPFPMDGDDVEWEFVLMHLPQLRSLSLDYDSHEGFGDDFSPTLGLVQIALECCPFLTSLEGTFDLSAEHIPSTPITRKHQRLEAINIGCSYFPWYTKDLPDDFDTPKDWVDRVSKYLTELTAYRCKVSMEEGYLSQWGIGTADWVGEWHRELVCAVQDAIRTEDARKGEDIRAR